MRRIALTLILTFCSVELIHGQNGHGADTVSLESGKLMLKGLLWTPAGHGPFPAIIFCHGSYGGSDTIHNPVTEVSVPGPVFASKGYIFFVPFRRGVGLSKWQGENSAEQMNNAFKEKGLEERNKVQLQQLETDQVHDMISALGFLRRRPGVDTNRIAVIGHSFGGSLALLLTEYEPGVKALIVFAAAGYSWDLSPMLRTRLIGAVKNINVPVMIIHAQNDYSTHPGYAFDSVMNKLHKPHLLKIYPTFGKSEDEGHNLIFLSVESWERDVFNFLAQNLRN